MFRTGDWVSEGQGVYQRFGRVMGYTPNGRCRVEWRGRWIDGRWEASTGEYRTAVSPRSLRRLAPDQVPLPEHKGMI